jgi:hypothetical protein
VSRAPLLAVAAALALVGCGMFDRPDETGCPRVSIVPDAAELVQFREGAGRDLTDIITYARLADASAGCDYGRRGVTIDLQVAIAAERGPANRAGFSEVDYFVALLDKNGAVRARESYRLRFEFVDNRNRIGRIEQLDPFIPLTQKLDGPNWSIWVGLQLTEEQLAWNRRGEGAGGSPVVPPRR